MDIKGNNRDEQISAQPEDAHAAQIEGRLKELHTYLPGIVDKFDPATQTASVQPAIKRIFTEKGAVNLPLCVDVPVEFPGGGGFFLTFPVKQGDECTLAFSERCIDFWFENGGVQLPAEYRLHDYSDAFARVGVNSKPNKLASFQTGATELRSRDRSIRVTVKSDGTIENVNPNGSTILSAAGKFTINAPGGFEVNAPHSQINSSSTTHAGDVLTTGNEHINGNLLVDGTTASTGKITGSAGMAISGGSGASAQITGDISSTGTITALTDVVGGGKSLKTHTHTDPQGGNTGPPT